MLVLLGVIIGVVMGLTGAGGALVAIPLFMQFQGMSLKEASVFSLIAVVIASLSNFYYQRKNSDIKLASVFVLSSAIGSFASQPYKKLLPDMGMAIMLTMVALYSLYNVWRPQKKVEATGNQPQLFATVLIGLVLGLLTTFTGLGGGVLMLPVLLGFYKMTQVQAVATSLLVVGLSSLASFLIQVSKGIEVNISYEIIGLTVGIFASSYLLKILITKASAELANNIRKVVFTLVVILALVKIF